jgi:hypothetical protein
MSFSSKVSNLLTNKYFLYFIVFLAASNVLGYLVTNKVNAVIFFALVAFLASNFSKNMTVILLVAIVATNLLMANKSMREGLEGANKSIKEGLENATTTNKQDSSDDDDNDKLDNVDPELSHGLKTLQSSDNTEEAKQKLENKKENTTNASDQVIDPNNRDLNNTKDTSNVKGVASKKSGFHNPKGRSSLRDAAPVNGSNARIDYATTLEDAYDNLDKILGSDGINKLTNDTQRLMQQQQKLFDTMSNMMPMIDSAKDMMGSIDMSQLGGLADLAGNLGGSEKKK